MTRPFVRLAAGKIAAFKPKNGVDYVGAKKGVTEIVGTMPIGGTADWSLIGLDGSDPRRGIKFSGAQRTFDLGGGITNVKIQGADLATDGGLIWEGNTGRQFTVGQPASMLVNECLFEHCALSGSAGLFTGNWNQAADLKDVVAGLRVKDMQIRQNAQAPVVSIRGCYYDLELDDLDIESDATSDHDEGWLYLECGSPKIRNWRRRAAYGYAWRIFVLQLKGIGNNQDCKIENALDFGTGHYGGASIRGDDAANNNRNLQTGKFSLPDFYVSNFSSLMKKGAGYITPLLLVGGYKDQAGTVKTIYLDSCLALDGHTDRQDLLVAQDNPDAKIVITNSYGQKSDQAVPAGWLNGDLVGVGGSAAGKGWKGPGKIVVPAIPADPAAGGGSTGPVTPPKPAIKAAKVSLGTAVYTFPDPKLNSQKEVASVDVTVRFKDGSSETHTMKP